MTLGEAIDFIQQELKWVDHRMGIDNYNAHNIGLEAMKRIKKRRDLGTGWEITLLPGETKE